MKTIAIALALIVLTSCAPMPGDQLIRGISEETRLSEIDVNITYGPWETTKNCTNNLMNEGQYGLVALNCIANACLVLGCAKVHWNKEGKVTKCDIYAAWDLDFIVNHELEHCRGYADVLY